LSVSVAGANGAALSESLEQPARKATRIAALGASASHRLFAVIMSIASVSNAAGYRRCLAGAALLSASRINVKGHEIERHLFDRGSGDFYAKRSAPLLHTSIPWHLPVRRSCRFAGTIEDDRIGDECTGGD
jgi:hypothetical protein